MKNLLGGLVLCALIAVCGQNARAGEPNLSAMGLGGMKKITQSQAKQIRGEGGIVFGRSFVFAPYRLPAPVPGSYYREGNLVGGLSGAVGGAFTPQTESVSPIVFSFGGSFVGGF